MSLYKNFETDEEAESGKGVALVVDRTEDGKPVTIYINRAGGSNRRFNDRYAALSKPFQRQIANGTMDPEEDRRITIRLFAETVIRDWENVTDENGEPLEFSVENAIKVLTDLPELRRQIQQDANDRTLFLKKTRQDAAGN